jgi:hypothetical protein
MRNRNKWAGIALLLGSAAALSNVAQAVVTSCPGTAFNFLDREFAIDTAAAGSCVSYGNGNFENAAGGEDVFADAGWITIDKTDGSGGTMTGALSVSGIDNDHGSFSISSTVWDTYAGLLFVMKSGTGQYNPDWAVFSLASGTTGGSWSIWTLFDNADGLSHVNIYGRGTPTTTRVPEPATLAMFGAGLFGLALVRRRRLAPTA